MLEKKRDPIKSVASDYIKNIHVLCLDEMQITDVADAMIVGRVFEEFFNKKLTLVTTSNRHPRDLYKNGLNRKLFLPYRYYGFKLEYKEAISTLRL